MFCTYQSVSFSHQMTFITDMFTVNQTRYKQWQRIVKGCVNDVSEYHRLQKELGELEKSISTLQSALHNRRKEVENESANVGNIERDVQDLRELLDASKIWVESASRISLQREQANQKEADFRLMNSDRDGRDLKQVEAELVESNRKKDEYNGTSLLSLTSRVQLYCRFLTLFCLFGFV